MPRNFPCIVPSIRMGVTCMAALLIYVKLGCIFEKQGKGGPTTVNQTLQL